MPSLESDSIYLQTFSDADKAKSPQTIIAEVPSKLSELSGKEGNVVERGAVQAIVGEYSCVLDGKTWSKAPLGDRTQLTIQFGREQSRQWHQRSAGSYFWTLKMDWMDGGDWGFVQQTKTRAIVPPSNLTLATTEVQARIGVAQGMRASKRTASVAGHTAYWSNAAPRTEFEHWRYECGWDVGFADAMAFFGMRAGGALGKSCGVGGDRIGCLDLWVRKRIQEAGTKSGFLWEFETGLRQGVRCFEDAVGL